MIETEGEGSIIIAGEVQGDVEVPAGFHAIIAKDASVHGNIYVGKDARLAVEGEVQGDITALGSVIVANGADVQGNINSAATA